MSFELDPVDAARAAERLAWRLARAGKDCSSCGVRKPLGAFRTDLRSQTGVRGTCKECENAAERARRERG